MLYKSCEKECRRVVCTPHFDTSLDMNISYKDILAGYSMTGVQIVSRRTPKKGEHHVVRN